MYPSLTLLTYCSFIQSMHFTAHGFNSENHLLLREMKWGRNWLLAVHIYHSLFMGVHTDLPLIWTFLSAIFKKWSASGRCYTMPGTELQEILCLFSGPFPHWMADSDTVQPSKQALFCGSLPLLRGVDWFSWKWQDKATRMKTTKLLFARYLHNLSWRM